jgi:hypothetical protein
VEIRIERATDPIDRLSHAVGVRATGPLVEEDGSATGAYGRASRISATSASEPVKKYRVSSFV